MTQDLTSICTVKTFITKCTVIEKHNTDLHTLSENKPRV